MATVVRTKPTTDQVERLARLGQTLMDTTARAGRVLPIGACRSQAAIIGGVPIVQAQITAPGVIINPRMADLSAFLGDSQVETWDIDQVAAWLYLVGVNADRVVAARAHCDRSYRPANRRLPAIEAWDGGLIAAWLAVVLANADRITALLGGSDEHRKMLIWLRNRVALLGEHPETWRSPQCHSMVSRAASAFGVAVSHAHVRKGGTWDEAHGNPADSALAGHVDLSALGRVLGTLERQGTGMAVLDAVDDLAGLLLDVEDPGPGDARAARLIEYRVRLLVGHPALRAAHPGIKLLHCEVMQLLGLRPDSRFLDRGLAWQEEIPCA